MTATRNTLAEAIEEWRDNIDPEQRDAFFKELEADIRHANVDGASGQAATYSAVLALLRAAAEPEAKAPDDGCTCSYHESDEMTRHAPLCKLAGAW